MGINSLVHEAPPDRRNAVGRAADPLVFGTALLALFLVLSEFTSTMLKTAGSAVLAVWLIAAFALRPGSFFTLIKKPKYQALLILLLYYLLALFLSMSAQNTVKYILAALMVYSPMIIYDYYSESRPSYARTYLCAVIAMLIYLSVRTLYFLSSNPGLARAVSSTKKYGDIGIGGGFMLAYALSIALPAIFFMMKFSPQIKPRLVALFLPVCGLLGYTVYRSDYALAFLIMAVGCAAVLLVPRSKKLLAPFLILLAAAVVAFGVAVLLFYTDALTASGHARQSYIARRIGELINGLRGLGLSSDLAYRLQSVSISLRVFAHCPVSGIGFFSGFDNAQGLLPLGQHSEWADALAKWGILGAAPYFMVIAEQLRGNCRKNTSGRGGLTVLTSFAVFAAGLINPCFYAAFYAVISVVVPGLWQLFSAPEKGEESG